MDQVRDQIRVVEDLTGKGFRLQQQSVAGFGAQRFSHVHARHDGYHFEFGVERGYAARIDHKAETNALDTTLTAASSSCSAKSH